MLAGCLLAALTYVPLFMALKAVINPGMAPAVTTLSLPARPPPVAHPLRADAVRDHGLRSHRRLPRGAFPDLDPLHVDVAAVPPGQRLVRRLLLIATAVTTSAWSRETFGAGAIYTA